MISGIEKAKIIGIGARDLRIGQGVTNLSDLSVRQFAYTLAGVYNWLLPSDMLELGGELELWMTYVG